MSEPDLSTLPKRMRYAADVMDEAKKRLDAELGQTEVSSGSEWPSQAIRKRAQIWEDRRRESAERDVLVETLAGDLFRVSISHNHVTVDEQDAPLYTWPGHAANPGYFRDKARHLIQSGWRKADPGE